MNADLDHRFALEGWVWALAAFALALILGAIYWSTRPIDYQPTDADTNRYAPVDGEQVQSVAAPAPTLAPPDTSLASDTVDLQSPSVKVTEVRPVAAPKPLPRLAGNAEPKTNAVADMFPVGRIAEPPARQVEPAAPRAEASADYPSFYYGGKTWSYTGERVSGNDIDLVPVGSQVSDREVYALSGDGALGDVLFVASANEVGEYAVYRQG